MGSVSWMVKVKVLVTSSPMAVVLGAGGRTTVKILDRWNIMFCWTVAWLCRIIWAAWCAAMFCGPPLPVMLMNGHPYCRPGGCIATRCGWPPWAWELGARWGATSIYLGGFQRTWVDCLDQDIARQRTYRDYRGRLRASIGPGPRQGWSERGRPRPLRYGESCWTHGQAETPPRAVAQQHADPPATGLQAWEPSGASLGAKRHGQRRTGADTSGHYRTTRSRSGARRNTSFRELYSSRKPRMPGSSAVTPSGITSRPAGHYGTMPTSNDSLTNTATRSPAGSTPQCGQARQAAGIPGDRCHRRALQKDAGVSWQGLNGGTVQLDGAEFSGGTVN